MVSSYKTVLMANIDIMNQSKLVNLAVKNIIKKQQILINISQDSNLALEKMSQLQLVEKIKKTLGTIAKEGELELIVKTVNHYPSGNIVIEMSSNAVVKYLCQNKNRKAFINKLEPSATIKDRSYTITLQFVPVSFNPS